MTPTMDSFVCRLLATLNRSFAGNASKWSLASGLSRSHVGQLAMGKVKRVELDTIVALAKAADVSPSWLAFGGDE